MYSAAAQLKDIQTVDWNQVCIATSSDVDMLSLLSIIEEGMPDHRCRLPSHLRDYHQLREHLYSIDGVSFIRTELSFHHPSDTIAFWLSMQLTRVFLL